MKRSLKLAVVGCVAYLLFMVALAPASWWLKLAPLPAGLQLGPVSGTLWRGEVQAIAYKDWVLPTLQWQLQPWSLVLLTAKLQFDAGSLQQNTQPYLQGSLQANLAGWQLQDLLVKTPVAPLVPLLQLPLPVQAGGDLLLEFTTLKLTAQGCQQLAGQASWLNASLQPPTGTWLDLQQIHASLSCEDGQPVLITDPANVLSLDIRATVTAQGKLTVNGSLLPAAELPAEVHQAMRFVGQPDANGRYPLRF